MIIYQTYMTNDRVIPCYIVGLVYGFLLHVQQYFSYIDGHRSCSTSDTRRVTLVTNQVNLEI